MAEDYIAMARKAAEQEGVDADLFGKLVHQESRYNPKALSPKGAQGLTQLMPATAKELGVDPADPWQNLIGGARYLRQQLKAFEGDVPKALAAYNAGAGNVRKYGGVPPFAETQDYVRKITGAEAPAATVALKPVATDQRAIRRGFAIEPDGRTTNAALDTEEWSLQIKEQTKPTLLEMVGAGFANNTDGEIIRGAIKTFGTEPYVPEPGYQPTLDTPQAMASRDLYDRLALSRNPQEEADILAHEADAQERAKTLMSRGGMVGAAIMLGTEVTAVSNLLPAVGVYKAMHAAKLGSAALALQGERGASVAASVGENLLSGTAIEGLKQRLNDEFKPGDLFLAAALDTSFGVGFGALGIRDANRVLAHMETEASLNRAVAASVEREVAREAEVRAQLGPDAQPEQIAAEMERMHTAEHVAPIHAATQDLPSERRIIEGQELPKVLPAGAGDWHFKTPGELVEWRKQFEAGGKAEGEIAMRTGGALRDIKAIDALPPGFHPIEGMPKEASHALVTANKLVSRFLGDDFRVVMHMDDLSEGGRLLRGDAMQVSANAAIIRVNSKMSPTDMLRTTVHEVGHIIFNKHTSTLPDDALNKLNNAYKRMTLAYAQNTDSGLAARSQRFSLLNSELMPDIPSGVKVKGDPAALSGKYDLSRNEFHAEQVVKYFEEDVRGGNKIGLPEQLRKVLKDAIMKVLEFLHLAKRADLGVTDEYREVLDVLAAGGYQAERNAPVQRAGTQELAAADKMTSKESSALSDFMTNPDAIRLGLTNLPLGTPVERAEAKSILDLHLKGEAWALKNPMDDAWKARAKQLSADSVFSSTGLTMLSSPSPLVRMLASELLEDASGVAGKRNSTAAITKYMYERAILGNTKNDVQGAYALWKKARGFGHKDDVWGGNNWAQFNREVAAEIESRGPGVKSTSKDGNVVAAADSLEAAYTRSADIQRKNEVLGSGGLKDSVGYMPHLMSAKKIGAMTNAQRATLQSALTDQYVTLSGWDISFSDNLAASVVERMRERAAGGYAVSAGGVSTDLLTDSMRAMGLTPSEIVERLKAIEKGAASHTKKRIQLDLNREYDTPEGAFKLLDIFETDQITLLDHQTQRVSGESALAHHGVQGRPGLELIRKAINHGEDGKQATLKDKEAFAQTAAEFMGQPFGTEMGMWMQRAVTANAAVRLGGIVYNQFAEFINGVFHVGAARTMDSIGSIGRLRSEIIALSKGEKVDNPFLSSIELTGGAEFGTDAYKIVMPFDNPTHMLPAYGRDSVTAFDRILRGAGHVQSVLSGWRLMHSAQQRGMAEQIVHKIGRYVREGKDDIALRQFGITEEVQQALKADLDKVATFDASGKLTSFDVTKMTDIRMQEALIQAVHRGTMQIIQGTFIGEKGKWAHDGWMKALTQFRSFSLVSMEKQWGRQRNSRGAIPAFGMIMGSMSIAAPIYMARVYANSVGREDQQEYLDRMLRPQMVARATLNYIAASGMGGDFLDLSTSVLPDSWDLKPTGGRSGQASDFVGTYVLPSSSLINDGYKYLQGVDNLHNAAKLLPFSRLPYVLPGVNRVPDLSE